MSEAPPGPGEYHVHGRQVIVGADRQVLRDCVVSVRDGVITRVGPPEPGTVHDETLRFDTVLPGLIDAHVHVGFRVGELFSQPSTTEIDEILRRASSTMEALLRHGVTTVRDLGSAEPLFGELVRAFDGRDPRLPRFIGAGRPITVPGGHLASFGWPVRSPDDARAAVVACQARGAGVVKVVVTGGRLTPGTPMGRASMSRPVLDAVVSAAHAAGLPVAAHVHGTEGVVLAVECDVDTLEHCSWTDGSGRIRRPVRRVLDEIVLRGQVVVTAGPLPGSLVRSLRDGSNGTGLVVPADRKVRRQIALWRNAWTAREHGVPVAVGTDSMFGAFPDASDLLARAVLMNALADWDPLAIVEAMTGVAGRACRRVDGLGVLRPGAPADLLAVNGDPLQDIRRLGDVALVMRGGAVGYVGQGRPVPARTRARAEMPSASSA